MRGLSDDLSNVDHLGVRARTHEEFARLILAAIEDEVELLGWSRRRRLGLCRRLCLLFALLHGRVQRNKHPFVVLRNLRNLVDLPRKRHVAQLQAFLTRGEAQQREDILLDSPEQSLLFRKSGSTRRNLSELLLELRVFVALAQGYLQLDEGFRRGWLPATGKSLIPEGLALEGALRRRGRRSCLRRLGRLCYGLLDQGIRRQCNLRLLRLRLRDDAPEISEGRDCLHLP
mmetsp:Transcript_32304/g.68800  ORF Transcript_32304/g.68800 Transcript_32304/m.68800 type:complete len:230 (-) Transcript_32304:1016-1705(-)